MSPMLARLYQHLVSGSLEQRSSAAERLFNLSAEDEGAQLVLSSPPGIHALVRHSASLSSFAPPHRTTWHAFSSRNRANKTTTIGQGGCMKALEIACQESNHTCKQKAHQLHGKTAIG